MKINWKSDFKLLISFKGEDDSKFIIPNGNLYFDFFSGTTNKSYSASLINKNYNNLYIDNENRIIIVFDNHKLSPGKLECTLTTVEFDSDFPDQNRRTVIPLSIGDVYLVKDAGDDESSTNLQVILNAGINKRYVDGKVEYEAKLREDGDKLLYDEIAEQMGNLNAILVTIYNLQL